MKDLVLNAESYYFYLLKINRTYTVDYTNEPRRTYEIYYIEKDGTAEYTAKGITLTLKPGQLLYIPPDITYKLVIHNTPGTVCYGRTLCFRFFPDVEPHDFPPQIVTLDDTLRDLLDQVPIYSNPVNCAFLFKTYQFLDAIQPYMNRTNEKYIAKIKVALEYMNTHDNYTIPELAKLCNMSEAYFYALFRKSIGISPIEMKQKLQATKAEQLLKTTNLSIDEIAERVGFFSTSHFRSVFRRRFGCSPHDVRKKTQK